jgi:bacterioferritin-associated ferredoxin
MSRFIAMHHPVAVNRSCRAAAGMAQRRRLTVTTALAARQDPQTGIVSALFHGHFFRFIPFCSAANAVVWNCLKRRFFLLHPAPVLNIQKANPSSEPLSSMIVCSCNVFTDHDVRNAVSVAQLPPRTPGQVYGCLGCSAQCGRCARTIKKIMDEALGACAKSCCSGCPHSQAGVEPHAHAEFSLAAS